METKNFTFGRKLFVKDGRFSGIMCGFVFSAVFCSNVFAVDEENQWEDWSDYYAESNQEESYEEKHEQTMQALKKAIETRNRLSLWVAYREALARGVKIDLNGLRRIDKLLAKELPYEVGGVVEKTGVLCEKAISLEGQKKSQDSCYWNINKSDLKTVLIASATGLGASLLGCFVASRWLSNPANERVDNRFRDMFLTVRQARQRHQGRALGGVVADEAGGSFCSVDDV